MQCDIGIEIDTDDEILVHHHPLDGNELEQRPGDSVGQRSLACCTQWD